MTEKLTDLEKNIYDIIFEIDNGANVQADEKRFQAAKKIAAALRSAFPSPSQITQEMIEAEAGAYATKFKTQVSSEGLENIHNDYANGMKRALELLSGVREQGWISVKKRLPLVNQRVLAVSDRALIKITWVDSLTREFDEKEIDYEDGERYTYWQPLPSPPNP